MATPAGVTSLSIAGTAAAATPMAALDAKTAGDRPPIAIGVAPTKPPKPAITDDELAAIVQTISRNKNAKLDFSSKGINDAAMQAICPALKANKILRTLILIDNMISDNGATLLADALKKNRIFNLVLDRNNIGNAGAQQLAAAIEPTNSVRVLILTNNNIQNEGAEALCQMLIKRKHPFEVFMLGGNLFDDAHAKLISRALEGHQPQYIHNMLAAAGKKLLAPEFLNPHLQPKLNGEALARKLAENPKQFLVPHPQGGTVMLGAAPYGFLHENHDFSHYSRHFPAIDGRKLAEDALVACYQSKASKKASFKFATIDAGEFFPTLVNIAKLALAGQRGKHFIVDLIDESQFGNHELFARGNDSNIRSVFEFMAFLHRMGIQVKLDKEKGIDEQDEFIKTVAEVMSQRDNCRYVASNTPVLSNPELVIENCSFTLYQKVFPKPIPNPLAVVSIALYDSLAAYVQSLKVAKVSPDAILDIHSSRSNQYLKELQDQVDNDTTLFLLYQTCGNVSVNAVAVNTEGSAGVLAVANDGATSATAMPVGVTATSAGTATGVGTSAGAKRPGFNIHFNVLGKVGGQWIERQTPVTFSSDFASEEKRLAELRLATRLTATVDPFAVDSKSATDEPRPTVTPQFSATVAITAAGAAASSPTFGLASTAETGMAPPPGDAEAAVAAEAANVKAVATAPIVISSANH